MNIIENNLLKELQTLNYDFVVNFSNCFCNIKNKDFISILYADELQYEEENTKGIYNKLGSVNYAYRYLKNDIILKPIEHKRLKEHKNEYHSFKLINCYPIYQETDEVEMSALVLILKKLNYYAANKNILIPVLKEMELNKFIKAIESVLKDCNPTLIYLQ